ncbi:MAG: antibiotic biosynthesis monooxygenase family protein [Thermodesulfobacteriota bacterium]
MTISRHWKGVAKPEEADHYIHHLQNETFPELARIEGFIEASILKRPIGEGTEFLIVTTWQSIEAIRNFAGESATTAVVPPPVQLMMVEYDREVAHYEIVEEYSP